MPVDNLLLEIGTEELPPKSLNRLRGSLAEGISAALKQAGLEFDRIESFATPRRLAVRLTGLSDRQPDQVIERKGPAVKAAFDDHGKPTKALDGFMRSCGISEPGELETLDTDKGSWLVYRAEQPGQALETLLPEVVSQALSSLPIDRRMRWGSNRHEFVRPVHWIVCLFGDRVLPVNILGLSASNRSSGHRYMSEGVFEIDHADSYVEACRTRHVMVDFEERQALILDQIREVAVREGGALEEDEALLEEVTSLVEWPVALAGIMSMGRAS